MTRSLERQTVAIVGLGLMGGSLALALRDKVSSITGVDPDQDSLEDAFKGGIIHRGTTDLREGVQDADSGILAAPVRVILELLHNRQGSYLRSNTLLLDLGSTKAEICEEMGNLPIGIQAMGGHPMCGKEQSGLQAAEATLYRGRPFVLCPPRRATPAARIRALELVDAIGAIPIEMDAIRHDRLVAGISHLPYLLSASLVNTISAEGQIDPTIWELAAGGFRDTSRLAGSSVRMMTDIISTNRTAIMRLLALYRVQLAILEASLVAQDNTQLEALLQAAHDSRETWAEQHLR
jgi:prephenate dehydrogenase